MLRVPGCEQEKGGREEVLGALSLWTPSLGHLYRCDPGGYHEGLETSLALGPDFLGVLGGVLPSAHCASRGVALRTTFPGVRWGCGPKAVTCVHFVSRHDLGSPPGRLGLGLS